MDLDAEIEVNILNMNHSSLLSETLNKISSLFEDDMIGLLSSTFIWDVVLGVMPVEFHGIEKQILEQNKKDKSTEKTENIKRLTFYATQIMMYKPDHNRENRTLFSQALLQLMIYSEGDDEASESLKNMKKLFIAFMKSWYGKSLKSGTARSAAREIRLLAEKRFVDFSEFGKELLNIIL